MNRMILTLEEIIQTVEKNHHCQRNNFGQHRSEHVKEKKISENCILFLTVEADNTSMKTIMTKYSKKVKEMNLNNVCFFSNVSIFSINIWLF